MVAWILVGYDNRTRTRKLTVLWVEVRPKISYGSLKKKIKKR